MNPDPEFWRGRSVLITGNTGFKGAWLSLWLSRLGARVTGLALAPDTHPSLFELAINDKHVKTAFIDVRDFDAVRSYMEAVEPNVVFHMAAQSLVRPSYRDPVGTYATNVMGTVHVLEAIRQIGVTEAAIIVTSDKCYENREWHWAYREHEPMGGHDPYSSSKGCAELVTGAYRNSFFANSAGEIATNCRVASVRAGNVIGGGDWAKDRLVPDIVSSLSRSVPVEIRNPTAIRPWQHVLEPLSGYVLLAERLLSPNGKSFAEAWNFGPPDEDCRPVSYIVDRVAREWGNGARWCASKGPHPHESTFLKVDSSKSRARLGWKCRMPVDVALDWTVEWYAQHRAGESAGRLTLEQIERYERFGG